MVRFGKDDLAFRYADKRIHQALIQKLARVVSGLHAARLLMEHGFFQEQAALQRMLDELNEDILFLAHGVIFGNTTDLHQEYLAAFYEEEFDNPDSAIESTQKRPMVPRQKIRTYLSRVEGPQLDFSSRVETLRSVQKAYSRYVHGASPVLATSFIRDGCGLPTPPFGSRGGARPTPGRPRSACRALRGQAAAAGSGSAARSPGAVAPR